MADSTKSKKPTYQDIKQGVEQIHPKEKDTEANAKVDLDVVFVPGLGTDPKTSWQPKKEDQKGDWNWAFDEHGLRSIYPAARILLYSYESDWKGSLKVEQFLDNLAKGLVESLQRQRPKGSKRPLVFIGHSMGGLVIAEALNLMDRRRDQYENMLPATAGCVFFGTPFLGTEIAEFAKKAAIVGEYLDAAINSKLLSLMTPGSEQLKRLRGEFSSIVTRMSPNIEVYCFWEEQVTEISKVLGKYSRSGAGSFSMFPASKTSFKLVSDRSATLENVFQNCGLASDHTNLVKFASNKDGRFTIMSNVLKRILDVAERLVRNRWKPSHSARDDEHRLLKRITEALGGGMGFRDKREALTKKPGPSSWLPHDPIFNEWLTRAGCTHDISVGSHYLSHSLWICGAEGRGKTGASIAALEQVETAMEAGRKRGEKPILAYYFCDSTDVCTAEELLKSLIWQLTQEEPEFATHAKQFTEKPGKSGRRATFPIEALWQSLQDMFSNTNASSHIYVIINNLHSLPAESDTTQKLFELINEDLRLVGTDTISRTPVEWLFTSRKARQDLHMNLNCSNHLIDLDDDKYQDQVQLELRKHAQARVAELSKEKQYKNDLAYFVSSLIGNRARTSGWIDITVEQLEEFPNTTNASVIRQKLKELPQHSDDLLTESWEQVFAANPSKTGEIVDILRALVLTYEDPSVEELAILADVRDLEELRATVELCSSFLTINPGDEGEDVVRFKNAFAKPHLLKHSAKLLGLSEEETRWQQGELALRSLSHLIEKYTLSGDEEKINAEQKLAKERRNGSQESPKPNDADGLKHVKQEGCQKIEDEEAQEEEEYEEEEYEADPEALPYMVKHWLHHASKSTPDLAEELSQHTEFWAPISLIRRRWLGQYKYIADNFGFVTEIPLEKWTALHVASSFGYRRLVSALIYSGYGDDLNKYDDWSYSPIHLAAFYGRPNIVEELLYHGAAADDAEKPGEETPLAMAAYFGHIKVMKLLLKKKANVNAESESEGTEKLVLNSAICSGNLDAVKLLVEHGANIHHEKHSPLKWAAALADRKIYDYLLEAGKKQLQQCDFGMALESAAQNGNTEILTDLLTRDCARNWVQNAMNLASDADKWDAVRLILEKHPDLDHVHLLKNVGNTTEDSDKLLAMICEYSNGFISQEALDQGLYEATDNEKLTTVQNLLLLGASANATGDDYGNALTAAAYDGQSEIVSILLKAGARVNSEDGWALQTAAGQGHIEVVKLLLKAGADVNACTKDERFPQGTALQAAVESSSSEIVTLLLSHKADPNLGAGDLACPLIAAACDQDGEILKQLVEKGANVNVDGGTSYSSTPLINAVFHLPVEYTKILLKAGAEINHVDVDGDTALICAAAEGDEECVKYLLEHGADVRIVSQTRGNALQAAFDNYNEECFKVLNDHVIKLLLKDTNVISESRKKQSEVSPVVVTYESEPVVESNVMGHTGVNTKWTEAKRNTYDGDDWGSYDHYDAYGSSNAPSSFAPPPGYGQRNDGPQAAPSPLPLSSAASANAYPSPPITYQSPPVTSSTARKPVPRTPSPQSLPPQTQPYGQQYSHQYNQQYSGQYSQQHNQQHNQQYYQQQKDPYTSPPPPQPSEQYSSAAYQQPDQQSGQYQPQYGAPPTALIPGQRTPSPGVKQGSFSAYQFFQR